MTHLPEPAPDSYSIPENLGEIRIFPRPVVWTAGLVIVALAAVGLYQGIHGAISGGAAGSGQEEEINPAGAISAQAAQPLSNAGPWSTLSGAAMASASAASGAPPVSSASSDDNQDNSSDNAPVTPTVSTVRLPPPPVQVPSAAPPTATSGQPADTMPPT
jgi:hypothetical protein